MRITNSLGIIAACVAIPTMSHAAFKFFDPTDTTKVPKLLSQLGFYSDFATKAITPEAVYYDVNSPLWSDAAHKYRWVVLPTGTKIKFEPLNDYWDYPDGATFVKLFQHEVVPGDPTTTVWWETRVLVNHEDENKTDKWFGFSYIWDLTGKEAYLVSNDGIDTTLTYYPNGKLQPTKEKKWHFPTRDQCMQCHRTDAIDKDHGRSVLGFFTAQINRPSKTNATVNQISEFFAKNIFSWTGGIPTAAQIATWPKWEFINDETKPLEIRARSYIGANCSGCHGTRGNLVGAVFGVNLNYDFYDMNPHMEFNGRELTWDFGIDSSALVVKGKPEKSIILFRQKNRNITPRNFDPNRFQMPPLATFEQDTAATAVLARWIQTGYVGMTGIDHGIATQQSGIGPVFKGRNLVLPAGLTGRVALLGMDGREIELQRNNQGSYTVPNTLKNGVYIVKVGAKSFRKYLL